MLDNGCPLDVISHILGHDSLDVTAHYAQVSTRLMMTTYNQAHPHARPDLKKPTGNESSDLAVSKARAVCDVQGTPMHNAAGVFKGIVGTFSVSTE
jgi:hypothetical protein